jgi:hypothetical protein
MVLWLLALSLALAAFSGSQANSVLVNKPKDTLVVLRYNNLSVPCSSPVVAGPVNRPSVYPLHSPAYNRRGPHIMLAAYYIPPLMSPASRQWNFFNTLAVKLGIEQLPYDGSMVVSLWPALSHKDWVVTGVPLTPLVNRNPLKVSQVCQ